MTVTSDGTLIIRNISRSDEGKYTCFAENFMGKANSTGILSVRGKDRGVFGPGLSCWDAVCQPSALGSLCLYFQGYLRILFLLGPPLASLQNLAAHK